MHQQSRVKAVIAAAALACASIASAAPITGEELPGSSSFDAPSTNALNFAKEVPGRVGQAAPYVLFVGDAAGEVTLSFNNPAPGVAFFEYRIDGVGATSGNAHWIPGDFIHPGIGLEAGTLDVERTFRANGFVEIRLSLGGERDWDFDWTAFAVEPAASVPEPAMPALVAFGLIALAAVQRKRGAKA